MSKTSFNINPSAILTTALGTAFLSCAAQVAGAIHRRRQSGRARGCTLQEMPDYILKDIGVTRFEIEYLVKSGRACRWRQSE
ncbi:DUF1127 domain-containing protein [Sinorhizobium meliloti]|uniref:DUF1127 domain-containing protein n=2 Tax=Rhizobium meliloti TaxID=382 RepID=F7XHE0_SINMM|nr:DUF1127 domain-containing protein [Sinorhizobium meliloti]AEG08474.1 protein of unknown function DUF1127 [Sinorhizobium meliloti BL225C]AEH83966.1 hypothetical protein SM11_pD1134 [Sinorhizobium meliloti SM11]ARS68901.1 hypothetical protein SMRU11_17775 [Sinorhizobium meliloti RU11/001]ASP56215.1 DUF1127 domain-containing protein [Sinorhizobium meliloti]ASP62048.1 DUF1127 domain-containing protein [Sinorhizobium meliloti]